ncbi:hypothetical protein [Nocardia sp. NPDC006630]|uniref:hypothetical protein n=1 Tax=Nocardia sp. NPDC006630 TaxID=3157181 RepID=UPI0033A812C1
MNRKEATAGAVLGLLALIVVAGWYTVPGESAAAVGGQTSATTPPAGDGTLTYTAVNISDIPAGAVTATILAFMIIGAALIGLFFYSPRPVRIRQQPRRSGAVVDAPAPETYSSMAFGAVLETVIRNSALLFVFLSRSTSRSMA